MKVIHVSMDDRLLRDLNRKARASRSTRAGAIREACEKKIRKLEEDELERRYIEGYRRKPENPAWGEVGINLAAEVWPR